MLKSYKWAKIYKGKNEDPADKWFVYYSYLNPNTAKFERIKVYEDINYLKDAEETNAYANELVKEINTGSRQVIIPSRPRWSLKRRSMKLKRKSSLKRIRNLLPC